MNSLWIIFLLLASCTTKADDSVQTNSGIREVFCADGAGLFFVSTEKDVTSPSTKTRLRILRFQDGKLLLNMEQQLVYPVVPNLTPVFLSEEDKLIMLPDLETKGAAIGLQLPEGLQSVVHGILHQPSPPEHIALVLTRAESVAAGLVHRAEAMGGLIGARAASLIRVGPPAAPGTHSRLKASAHYARTATDRVVETTTWATNLVGQATEKVGQVIKPVMPRLNRKTKLMGAIGKPGESTRTNNNPTEKIANDITAVSMEALDKITEALKKSAQILATSIKENTVKVVQHKFGEDMGEAMGDMFVSVKNTVTAAQQLRDLRPTSIAQKAVKQIAAGAMKGQAEVKHPQYTCKGDL